MNVLSTKQKRCARYIGLGMTQADAARRVVVNVRTVRRWLVDIPEFAALVQSEREAGREMDAEDVLRDLLLSTDERVRLAAADRLIRLVPARAPDTDSTDDLLDPAAWK